jgi:hypothetical protein
LSWQAYETPAHVVAVLDTPSMDRAIVLTAWSSFDETATL